MYILFLFLLWLAFWGVAWFLYRRGRLDEDYSGDVLALGALALATVGFFWRLLFTPTWMPADGGDLLSFLFPLYRFAAQSLREGEIPLWNPYLYSGAPFAADIQSGIFYPPNLLAFTLVPTITFRTMELLSVFHFFLAGSFMYLCLRFWEREERLSRLSCLAGAIAFAFSDLFITHFGNLNMIAAASWLPIVLLLYHRALVERRVGYALSAGVALGVAILAGHIQPVFHILFLLGLYLLYRVYVDYREERGGITRLLGLSLLTLLVASAGTAFFLLPAYEMSQLSVRADIPYQEAAKFSLHPAQLLGLLNPGFFGRGPRLSWGLWERVEVGYIGVLPLVLASWAVLLRKRLTPFLVALALLSLLMAFGDNAILHGWLYGLLPGFNQLRAPARFILLFDFAIAFLAAYGLDALLRPLQVEGERLLRRVLRFSLPAFFVVALLTLPLAYAVLITSQDKDPVILMRIGNAVDGLILFLLFFGGSLALLCARGHGWIGHRLLGLLAVGLIFLDLSATGAYVDIGTSDPTRGFHHPEALAFLREEQNFYRIEVSQEVWGVWQPDFAVIQEVFDVGGIYTPLKLADFDRYWQAVGGRSSPLYHFLNVKYLIVPKGAPPGEGWLLAFDGDPRVDIHRNPQPFPRAFIVHRSQVVSDHEVAFEAIQAPDFDPATSVVLEGGEALGGGVDSGEVKITSYSLNEIRLSVEAASEGYLVMSEVYYPGWKAFVDGLQEPVLRANYAFQAVHLEPGSYEVRMVFDPSSWRIGLLVAGGTWLAITGWGGWRFWRWRH